MKDQCFAMKGNKQCLNKAEWFFKEEYDDPLVIGASECQLCDECFDGYKDILRRFGPDVNGYKKRPLK